MYDLNKRLEKLIVSTEGNINTRQRTFEGRSAEWQESPSGVLYLENIECMREALDSLKEVYFGYGLDPDDTLLF